MVSLYQANSGGILADEMGLGKTIQTISYITWLYANRHKSPILILTPVSTLSNWFSEFAKFSPRLPVVTYHGSPVERLHIREVIASTKERDKDKQFPVILSTYDTAGNDVEAL